MFFARAGKNVSGPVIVRNHQGGPTLIASVSGPRSPGPVRRRKPLRPPDHFELRRRALRTLQFHFQLRGLAAGDFDPYNDLVQAALERDLKLSSVSERFAVNPDLRRLGRLDADSNLPRLAHLQLAA